MSFAIGVERPKRGVNVGTLWRSAYCLGASLVFTVGHRYEAQASDTIKTPRHLPLLHFEDWEDYRRHAPFEWQPIAVEIAADARMLPAFTHPRQAVYLLGPEDGSLSPAALALATHRVVIPGLFCLNVAVAGSIVMYDRLAKLGMRRPGDGRLAASVLA